MRYQRSIIASLFFSVLLLSACSGLWQSLGYDSSRQGVSSSLVDFSIRGVRNHRNRTM